jgi:hypothetical protein
MVSIWIWILVVPETLRIYSPCDGLKRVSEVAGLPNILETLPVLSADSQHLGGYPVGRSTPTPGPRQRLIQVHAWYCMRSWWAGASANTYKVLFVELGEGTVGCFASLNSV